VDPDPDLYADLGLDPNSIGSGSLDPNPNPYPNPDPGGQKMAQENRKSK
jgi:hypothetical protein